MEIADLPHVTAALNAAAAVLLAKGYAHIKRGNKQKHRAAMVSALLVSVLFLVVYTYYHLNGGFAKFGGEGIVRPIYFGILILHVIGAVILTPLVPLLVFRAFKGNFEGHRKIARFTWPLWMAVSVSGVVVYVMAIHLFPTTGA